MGWQESGASHFLELRGGLGCRFRLPCFYFASALRQPGCSGVKAHPAPPADRPTRHESAGIDARRYNWGLEKISELLQAPKHSGEGHRPASRQRHREDSCPSSARPLEVSIVSFMSWGSELLAHEMPSHPAKSRQSLRPKDYL